MGKYPWILSKLSKYATPFADAILRTTSFVLLLLHHGSSSASPSSSYILDKKMYNWPFPITLTMIHMAFCSSLTVLLIKVFKFVELVSVSREMLKALMPVAVYSIGVLLNKESFKSETMTNMLSISFAARLNSTHGE
ncbi:unnamed protein product [Microthlaspi erraticum]|uniref:Sugar phosphate transporter domain-containing protein n=1 Tax=Microthlaspi erraticum TaxID=1685480 RepID=A0A6D2HER4_9BRAS|nr:unnamed protein product [Microthlaspi erraticum]